MKSLFVSLAMFAALGVPMTASAAFPEKPIEIVVPFNAGGGTDIMTRIFAEHLAGVLESPVVVVNRPGAGGEVGMTEVAEATPDGYTLFVINTPNVLTIPIERNGRFSVDSFDLLGTIAHDPATLSVHAESEITSIEELAAVAGAAPEEITFGTAGVGSVGHIAVLLFEQAAGVSMRHIPYGGSSEVRTGLLDHEIMVAAVNLGEALTFADGQPWRILGVMASERVASQPNLPTFAEAGYPITEGSLRGLGAPAGTPDDVLETLRTAMAEVMASEAFIEASAEANVPLRYLDHEAYAATLAEASQRIQTLWEKTPWRE